jgi:hypothetical protein
MVKSGVQGEGFFLSVNPGVWKKLTRRSDLPDLFDIIGLKAILAAKAIRTIYG